MATENENNKVTAPQQTVSGLTGSGTQAVTIDATPNIDIDTSKHLIDTIIEAGLQGGLDASALESFTSISNNRDQIYQLIDTMGKDASVSAILRVYAEDCTETADNGHIMWCEASDPNISKFVNYLLNVMNVDKKLYSWAYALVKYGDVYIRMFRESDYADPLFKADTINQTSAVTGRSILNEGLALDLDFEDSAKLEAEQLNENVILNVHKASDPYSYYVEMVPDPGTMFELTKFGKVYGYVETPNMQLNGFDYTDTVSGGTNNLSVMNYRLKSTDVNIYQADDFVHACLEDNVSRYPEQVSILYSTGDSTTAEDQAYSYRVRRGKSMLYDSYKVWREKSLLECSALLNRVTRSSLIRKVGVEVGDMGKEQVSQTLHRVKSMMEQKLAINTDESMTAYTNPGPIENNIYYATRNGVGAITVDSVGGDVNVRDLADLEWWNDKFYAAYGIPKQFLGWTNDSTGFNGGTSLTLISSVYAKSVKRIQNALIQAITDAVNLILLNKGLRSYINNFTIKMKAPLTQEEKDYRENYSSRISAISSLMSILSDVEDRGRKLTIIKELLGNLNLGDDILQELQKEIEAADVEKKAAAEAAAAEAEAQRALEAAEALEARPSEKSEDDLGLAEVAMESATPHVGTEILIESSDLVQELDGIPTDDSILPTPEALASGKDFTQNS